MTAAAMTILYWPCEGTDAGGYFGQLAGTNLQLRTDSLDELAERAEELHRALTDSDRISLALVPCAPQATWRPA
jgi:hypothetical protein